MSYCHTVQDVFFPAYRAVERLIDHRPTVTMGAAVLLLSGQHFTSEHDLDLLIPEDSPLFEGIETTTSACGTYKGKKRIMQIEGVTVELLGGFILRVPGGEHRVLEERESSMLVKVPTGSIYVPVTSSRTLEWFYKGMNRPKDQVKLQALEGLLS